MEADGTGRALGTLKTKEQAEYESELALRLFDGNPQASDARAIAASIERLGLSETLVERSNVRYIHSLVEQAVARKAVTAEGMEKVRAIMAWLGVPLDSLHETLRAEVQRFTTASERSSDDTSEDSMPCPRCSAKSPAGSKFCSACGGQLTQWPAVCPACASESPEGAAFCAKCGSQLGSGASLVASPATGADPSPPAPAQVQQPVQTVEVRPKMGGCFWLAMLPLMLIGVLILLPVVGVGLAILIQPTSVAIILGIFGIILLAHGFQVRGRSGDPALAWFCIVTGGALCIAAPVAGIFLQNVYYGR